MGLRLAHLGLLGGLVLACESSGPKPPPPPPPRTPPTEAQIGQAALAALAAAPWDADPTGWGALCSRDAPCDTLVIDPRIVSLPAQAPAFFVPDRRDAATTLSTYGLSLATVRGRVMVLGAWRDCSARRDAPGWSTAGVACVALGVTALESASVDAMSFALLVATPAKGLSWPRVRVTRPRESWRGRLISNAGR